MKITSRSVSTHSIEFHLHVLVCFTKGPECRTRLTFLPLVAELLSSLVFGLITKLKDNPTLSEFQIMEFLWVVVIWGQSTYSVIVRGFAAENSSIQNFRKYFEQIFFLLDILVKPRTIPNRNHVQKNLE